MARRITGPWEFDQLHMILPAKAHALQRRAGADGVVLQWIIYRAAPHMRLSNGEQKPFFAVPMLYDHVHHDKCTRMFNAALVGDTVDELRAVLAKYAIKLDIKRFTDTAVIEVWGPDPATFVPGPRH